MRTNQNGQPSRNRNRILYASTALVVLVSICSIYAYNDLVDGSNYDVQRQIQKMQLLIGAPSTSFQLAYDQSFGFFDDISDENWRRAQTIHARMFPNHRNLKEHSSGPNDKGNINAISRSNNWNGANFQQEFHCPLAQRIPTTSDADGPKWVCDPHRLRDKPDCLVYSVGSNGNVMFEKGIHDEIGPHCEIHTFDLVTYNRRNGHFEEALKDYATFHPWGLGTKEEAEKYERTKRGSAMKTLRQTMEELGHTGRTVDIFKIDCEWCEWFTYQEWLSDQVDLRQILVETHNAPMPHAKNFFYELHDHGYVIFSKEANYMNGAGCVEFAFLKLRTDFFNNSMYANLPSNKN